MYTRLVDGPAACDCGANSARWPSTINFDLQTFWRCYKTSYGTLTSVEEQPPARGSQIKTRVGNFLGLIAYPAGQVNCQNIQTLCPSKVNSVKFRSRFVARRRFGEVRVSTFISQVWSRAGNCLDLPARRACRHCFAFGSIADPNPSYTLHKHFIHVCTVTYTNTKNFDWSDFLIHIYAHDVVLTHTRMTSFWRTCASYGMYMHRSCNLLLYVTRTKVRKLTYSQ